MDVIRAKRAPLRIAVIGCGTAGAASALFLARAGHTITLLERVPEPGPVGAGVMIQPSGLAVLARLGCEARILARGARVDRLVCQNDRGVSILSLAYESLAPGLHGIGLHRGVLFETLYAAVLAQERIELRCGVGIERVGPRGRHGRSLVDDTGKRHGPFDLVVVCDGARSRVRDAMRDVTSRVVPYPWGALWFIADDRNDRYARVLFQKVRGTRRMAGMLPTGLGPGTGTGTTSHVSLFHSVRADAVDAWRRGGIDAWKVHVSAFAPETQPILDQIDHMDQLTFASYFDVTMPRWHANGVVFLGDAGHATSPQLGQGVNLALCDAMALDESLESDGAIDDALALYTQRRRDHLAFYQWATRWLTPFFQSDLEPLGWLRDRAMGPSSLVSYVEREMVRSMCGTKTGIVLGSFPARMPSSASGRVR